MGIQGSLGASYSISAGEPATYDDTGFAALTYTEVGEVANLGDFGPTFEDVTFVKLKTGLTEHRKGSVDYNELSMSIAYDGADAGQILIKAGVDGANRDVIYSHKIELAGGEIFYFTGQFFSAPISVADASSMVTQTVTVKPTGSVVDG